MQQDNIEFPTNQLTHTRFHDISSFKKQLNREARKIKMNQAESWYQLSINGDIDQFKCKYKGCPSVIRLQFVENQFRIIEINNKHIHQDNSDNQIKIQKQQENHSNAIKNDKLTQINENHLIKKYLNGFFKTQKIQFLGKDKIYSLQIGSSCKGNPGPCAISYCLKYDGEQIIKHCYIMHGDKTNNQAEFLAMLWGIYDCYLNKIYNVQVMTNSSVLINSMSQGGKSKSPNLQQLWQACKFVSAQLNNFKVTYWKRGKNDYLSQLCRNQLTKL